LIAVWQGFGFSFVTIVLTTTFLILDVILLLVPWYLDKRKHSEKADFFKRITRAQEGNEEPKTGYYWFRIIMGAKLYWLVLCILPIMMLLAVAAGSAYAKKQQNFLVVESEGLILIKRYGESYILRTIDLSKNNVSGEIVIWRSEDIAKHKLSPKVIKNIEIAI